MIVRRAREDDVPGIVEVWGELAAEHAAMDEAFAPGRGWASAYEEYLRVLVTRPDALVVAAFDDGGVAGIATGRLVHLPRFFAVHRRGHIQDVYVRPAYRRRGIGRRMVREILTWLRRNRITLVEMTVATKNPEATRFWESLGFEGYMLHMRGAV